MVEHIAMCEKILRRLEYILSTDPSVQDFSIVPTEEIEKNKSPVLYEQNCIGLESWCKVYLLQYTHMVLFKNRKALLTKQLPVENMTNLNHILIGALLIQPNVSTFWNMKRELIKSELLSPEQELNFSRIALTEHSKCSEIFAYRKWLIDLVIFKDNSLNLLGNELHICEIAADQSKNNYHAWNHRIWCMKKIVDKHSDIESIMLSELNFSINWISKHISENAGYHYRQFLIKTLNNLKRISSVIIQNFNVNNVVKYLKLPNFSNDPSHLLHYLLGKSNIFPVLEDCPKYINILAVLINDLMYISTELSFLYRDHQCLWNYRKFLVVFIMKLLYEYHGIDFTYQLFIKNESLSNLASTNMLNLDINIISRNEIPKKVLASDLYSVIIKNEIEFIEANKNTVNIAQNNLALRHLKWLRCTNFYID